MEKTTLVIAVFALVIAVPTAIGDIFHFIKSKRDSRFAVHCTCIIERDEKKEKFLISFICINFSLEPYSVLRIDYICGNEIQSIGLNQFYKASTSTLVPPQDVLILENIHFSISREILRQSSKDSTIDRGILLYTTRRKSPYPIPLTDVINSTKREQRQQKKLNRRTKRSLSKLAKFKDVYFDI